MIAFDLEKVKNEFGFQWLVSNTVNLFINVCMKSPMDTQRLLLLVGKLVKSIWMPWCKMKDVRKNFLYSGLFKLPTIYPSLQIELGLRLQIWKCKFSNSITENWLIRLCVCRRIMTSENDILDADHSSGLNFARRTRQPCSWAEKPENVRAFMSVTRTNFKTEDIQQEFAKFSIGIWKIEDI